jgi:tetratricopeptide (TPR) repeat protein
MTNDQLQQIERIFHEVLSLGIDERRDYLDSACGQDEDLRHEVEAFVSAYESSGSLLEESPITLAFKVMGTKKREPMAGVQIGQYKILRHLGHGGMGDVYLAEDHRLNRKVALKFLSSEFLTNSWARQQLIREAQAVAMLDHPNICAVHGFEEIGEHHFMVMQYVEGETLAALLRSKALDLELALDLAEQIACALAAAHERGIVHRDIKPQNIIVNRQGQVKILDFGLARLVPRREVAHRTADWDATKPDGAIIGTVAYMSPEQARGLKLDCRTDVFSFGVVLHEMLGRKNPFLRETQKDTVEAIQTIPPARLPSSLPIELQRLGQKCLEKSPELRYETGADLLAAIRRLRSARERVALIGWRRYLQYYAAATVILFLVVAGLAAYSYRQLTRVHTLAILPIQNVSGDPDKDYLTAGLTRSLFERLSHLPRLQVKLPTVVPAQDAERAVKAGRDLKAEAVLSGEVVKVGDKLLLRLRLFKTTSSSAEWQEDFDLAGNGVLQLQDAAARRVADSLDMWLLGGEKRTLTRRQTDNQDAMNAYMRGRYYWTLKRDRENIQIAIKFFDEAISLDPSYAAAYAGRAECYALTTNVLYGPIKTSEAIQKATYDARKALEIDPLLAEAHTSMGVIHLRYDWDWQEAEKEFKLALELNPNYAPAHFWYSNLLIATRRFDEALREAAAGKSLDPYSNVSAVNYARVLYYARRFDEAAESVQQVLSQDQNNVQAMRMLGLVKLQQSDYAGAIVTFERLHSIDPLQAAAALGYSYAKAGRRTDALNMIQELDELAKQKPVPPLEKALIYIGLGDRDKAFEYLEQAYSERFANLAFLTSEPIYDDLRADPRFAVLTRRVGLTF